MVVGKDSSGQFEWLSPGTVSPSHHTVLVTLQFSSSEASSIVIVTVFLDMIICRHTPILSLIFKHFRFWLITVMFEGSRPLSFLRTVFCYGFILSDLSRLRQEILWVLSLGHVAPDPWDYREICCHHHSTSRFHSPYQPGQLLWIRCVHSALECLMIGWNWK